MLSVSKLAVAVMYAFLHFVYHVTYRAFWVKIILTQFFVPGWIHQA